MTRVIRPSSVWGIIFGKKLTYIADRLGMGPDESLTYLHQRVFAVRESAHRSRHFAGRIYNLLTGSDSKYVVLTGPVLASVLTSVGHEVGPEFQRPLTYQMPLDVAEGLLARMTAAAEAEGRIR